MLKPFKGKKVLITGISGFVGSHLAEKMRGFGADVYGIAKNTSGKQIMKGDVANQNFTASIIKKWHITICFHLAGESLVEAGQEDPYHTFKTNIEGTLNILESARIYDLERVIIASTSHVYGHNRLPYYEGYTPRPSRPYETSKACTDLIAQSYANSFNLPVLIPRFVNIYGPGDLNFHRLIPKTLQAIFMNKSILMWGGSAIRDYLYIDDALDAYTALALMDVKKNKNNCIFNFGSGVRISVKELIDKIVKLSGKKVIIRKIKERRTEEIQSQYVSFQKAEKILNWRAKTSLDEGLKRTLAWYKRHLQR